MELSTRTDIMKFRLEVKIFIYSICSTVYETEIFVYDLEKNDYTMQEFTFSNITSLNNV